MTQSAAPDYSHSYTSVSISGNMGADRSAILHGGGALPVTDRDTARGPGVSFVYSMVLELAYYGKRERTGLQARTLTPLSLGREAWSTQRIRNLKYFLKWRAWCPIAHARWRFLETLPPQHGYDKGCALTYPLRIARCVRLVYSVPSARDGTVPLHRSPPMT
jgi:hypothetical protein